MGREVYSLSEAELTFTGRIDLQGRREVQQVLISPHKLPKLTEERKKVSLAKEELGVWLLTTYMEV